MEKIATGRETASAIDITAPIETNIKNIARAKHMSVREVTMMILDRPRHAEIVERVRKMGARVYLLTDGDVAGAITAARRGTGVDLLYGIGGTPEGVVAAAALKCFGGVIQGRLFPRDEQERQSAIAAGYDLDRVLSTDDLVKGDDVFFAATGITDGALVQGVRFYSEGATTESIVTRASTGTIRLIHGEHRAQKLKQIYGDEEEV
jgi:fructose-1,6-bisphosphatase II